MADRVVIMSRGKIEQIGSPQEIYHAPRNRFVAEFLGSSNIFAGHLVEKSGDDWVVETIHGRFAVHATNAPTKSLGDSVTFTVSAENMQISPADSGVPGIRARVVGEEFVGASAIVFLETETGEELKVQKSHEELANVDLHPGSTLSLHWESDSCHVLLGE